MLFKDYKNLKMWDAFPNSHLDHTKLNPVFPISFRRHAVTIQSSFTCNLNSETMKLFYVGI